jgi:hypothetical protein
MCQKTLICRLAGLIVLVGIIAAAAPQKTVDQLYAEKDALKGKTVTISGVVTRVTNNVMQRNFLHLRDGTGKEGSDDVTVTSQQTAAVGDKITVTGTLAVDRDFGAGYTYPVIIEQATISKTGQQ